MALGSEPRYMPACAQNASNCTQLSDPYSAGGPVPLARLAMRAHREALLATRNFWQYLLQQHITFTHLSKSLNAIESSIVKVGAGDVRQ